MGKRVTLPIAVFLIAFFSQINLPKANAQDETGCPSGSYSALDGSCLGSDQGVGIDQELQGAQSSNPAGSATGAYGSTTGAGSGAAAGLSLQYPGLSQQMNARIENFQDQGGLSPNSGMADAQLEQEELNAQNGFATAPTQFQQLVRSSIGKLLPVYGDSLFRRVPSTFAPLRDANVTSSYIVGPGDQLVIRIWGQVNFNANVTVDRSGSIYLPHVGQIHVAGLPYSQLQDHVRNAIGQMYKNFDVDVEMGQLRSIQVFVVGQARRPGTYTLSSLSTLVTALFASGGPAVGGSLRDIQLKRHGQTIAHFDLYDLLIFGDMSKDVPLLPGDVIFIPPVGPEVAVAGSVRNPAIYELKNETTVSDLLRYAGGLSLTASLVHASLERIDEHRDRTVIDLDLSGAGLQTVLRQGDLLRVLPIQPKFENAVTLRGNVAEPGRFAWHPGMRLSDIIPDSQSLITRDYWERRNQLSIPGPAFKPEYATNPDLYQRSSTEYGQLMPGYNSNNGSPGTTGATGQLQSTTASNPAYGQYNNQVNSQNSNETSGQNCNPSLPMGPGIGGAQTNSNNTQNGLPCTTGGNGSLATGEETSGGNLPRPTLKVVLPVPEIDWSYAVIERMNPRTLTTSLVPFNLGDLVLNHDPSQDLTLEPGDVITVFSQADIKVPQMQRTKFVRLEGEFVHAGIYSARPGETLRELVIRAGGLTPEAYLFGSSFTRESTRAVQQLRLNDYIETLQLNMDRATIAAAANGFDTSGSASGAAQNLISRLEAVRASGRIVLNMPPHVLSIDDIPNLPLEDGDTFTVPSKPVTVSVVGAVFNQNSFIYKSSRTVGQYLQLAGGPTQSADKGDAFIIRADGSVVSRRSQSGVFGNTFASGRLYAGDTVVIPEKVPKPAFWRIFQSYSSLFSSFALGAAAIAVLQ